MRNSAPVILERRPDHFENPRSVSGRSPFAKTKRRGVRLVVPPGSEVNVGSSSGKIELEINWEETQDGACVLEEGVSNVEVASFLDSIYLLANGAQEEKAIDKIIEQFELWLEKGDWSACIRVLAAADVSTLLAPVSLAMLTMTLAEKKRLMAARPTFYRRVRRRLIAEYGEQEATDNLQGLD